MPILSYLVTSGLALLGLLYVGANALGTPGPIPNSSSYQTVFKPLPPRDTVQILAVREAPAPDMTSTVALMSMADATGSTGSASPPPVSMQAAHRIATKATKTASAKKKTQTMAQRSKGAVRYVQYFGGRNAGANPVAGFGIFQ